MTCEMRKQDNKIFQEAYMHQWKNYIKRTAAKKLLQRLFERTQKKYEVLKLKIMLLANYQGN